MVGRCLAQVLVLFFFPLVCTMDEVALLLWIKLVAEGLFLIVLGAGIASAWILIPPILRPMVLSYPWRMPESNSYRERDKTRTVVMAGSFNPPHLGHLAMLEYLSKRYVLTLFL